MEVERQSMKKSRKKLDAFFAPPYIIVERIQKHMQSKTDKKVYQEDVGSALGIPPHVLTVMKARGSTSIPIFAVKWCLENGLDVSKFVERNNNEV